MKLTLRILIFFILLIFILYLWNEFPDLSLSKKINAEKVSSFFIAISSLLTAVTVFLIYNQILEQIENRKAASKPVLYPEDQFFSIEDNTGFAKLKRENKNESLIGLISLHNIGLGAAKEISVKWHFNESLLKPLIVQALQEIYSNKNIDKKYSFISANKQIEVQLPLMYLASLSAFKKGWTETIWEELYLEIIYKDIHDFTYPSIIFEVIAYVNSTHVLLKFHKADSIKLSASTTMRSTLLENEKYTLLHL